MSLVPGSAGPPARPPEPRAAGGNAAGDGAAARRDVGLVRRQEDVDELAVALRDPARVALEGGDRLDGEPPAALGAPARERELGEREDRPEAARAAREEDPL